MFKLTFNNQNKFKSLVHYICWRYADDPAKLGAVKLNKALWLSDLSAYYALGKPITNARYVKREFGPVPKAILPILRELESEGALEIRETPYFGRNKRTFVARQEASADFMSEDEKVIVEDTIKFVCEEHTAKSISNASHDHIWKAAEDGEEIPHFTVFALPDEITDEDRTWAWEQIEKAV